jgi:hypothetical protein
MTDRRWGVVAICWISVSPSCNCDEQDHDEPHSTAHERGERDSLIPPFRTPPENDESLHCDDLQ